MPRQKKPKKKLIIGVTGTFGSGKSTVSRFLCSRGSLIIDADKLAHAVLGQKIISKKIVSIFGRDILGKNKFIDKKKLAARVFAKRALLKKLNQIVHPEVIREIDRRVEAAKERVIILDAPLLIEAGLRNKVDILIVVCLTKTKQFARLKKKYGFSKKEVLMRSKAQLPLSAKVHLADFIIDNSGTFVKTQKQVREIRRKLWRS